MTLNNKGFLSNIILIIAVIVIVVIGIMIIKSIDHSRYQIEKLSAQLYKQGSVLKKIEHQINNKKFVHNISNSIYKNNGIANLKYFNQKAQFGGRLIAPVISAAKNMNYIINNDAFVAELWSKVNSSLAARDYEHPEKFKPLLAEKWELSDDKLVYTIELRKGVLWHDFTDPVTGEKWKNVEVTSEDFKFFLQVVKNKNIDCAPIRTYYKDLERIEIISKYKFKVYWNKKYFLSESSTLGLSPLPSHLYHSYKGPFDGIKFNDDYGRNKIIVGCGPYKFDRWDAGQRIILKKWDNYFGNKYGAAPPIRTLVYEIIKHPNTQFQSLLSEDIDKMHLSADQWVNRTDIPEFNKNSKTYILDKYKYPSKSYSYIGYNLKNPLFKDKNVRKALTHLVDRKKILKVVFSNLGRVVTGNFFIDSPYYDKSIKPYKFSIATAQKLLLDAGWKDNNGDGVLEKDGKPFKFTVLTISNSTAQEKMFPIIKEDMKKAGIVMNINKVEWSVYVQRLEKKDFDVVSLGWSMGFESDPFQIWHSSMADIMGSSNHIGFKNKKADRIIEKIRTCFDFKERVKLAHQFHELLHEEQPYTFLFCRDSLIAINNRYKNVHLFDKYPIIPEDIMWVSEDRQMQVNTLR
ncbi:MAG TPA: peptide-binding protein [Victivallales bacterium]|nr:peptide-binding protein [Victivallales bacterium]